MKKEFTGPGLHLRPVCADRARPPLQWTLSSLLSARGTTMEGEGPLRTGGSWRPHPGYSSPKRRQTLITPASGHYLSHCRGKPPGGGGHQGVPGLTPDGQTSGSPAARQKAARSPAPRTWRPKITTLTPMTTSVSTRKCWNMRSSPSHTATPCFTTGTFSKTRWCWTWAWAQGSSACFLPRLEPAGHWDWVFQYLWLCGEDSQSQQVRPCGDHHQGIGVVGLDTYTWGIKDFHKCWSGPLAKRRLCPGPAGVINCTPLSALSFWVSLFPGKCGYNKKTSLTTHVQKGSLKARVEWCQKIFYLSTKIHLG